MRTQSQNTEREVSVPCGPQILFEYVFEYVGMMVFLGERISVVEPEAELSPSIPQMIL